MIKIIQDTENITIEFSNSSIELIRCIDIIFSGDIHAVSSLPSGWSIMASNERIICLNLGSLNPSQIFQYTGRFNIKNIRVYDSIGNNYGAEVVFENNDYWENIGEVFNSSEGYYEFYDKEHTPNKLVKSTKIVTNNLSTNPDEFYFKDGVAYSGQYHVHQDGQAMTEAEHSFSSKNIYRKDAKGRMLRPRTHGKKGSFFKPTKGNSSRQLKIPGRKFKVAKARKSKRKY